MYLCVSHPDTSLYDASDISDNSESQDEDDNFTEVMPQPCRYYNSGGCRDGSKCLYLHICKYALKGNCRNGSNCSLSHSITGEARTRAEGQTPGDTQGRNFYEEIVLIQCTMLSMSM